MADDIAQNTAATKKANADKKAEHLIMLSTHIHRFLSPPLLEIGE